MQAFKTDVLIVGAGPTGLSLACQLIRHGIDFIALDKNPGITAYSKAIGVHARTLEIYEQLGIADKAAAEGTIAKTVHLLANGKVRGSLELSHIGEGMSPYPFLLILEQSKNERLLYDYFQAPGKDVLWQTELTGFSQTDSEVTAQIRGASGESVVKARYLVGCDGPHSLVRHQLGLAFQGSTFERIFYVADAQIDWRFSHDALHVCLARSSGLAFFPMPGEKRYRIVGVFPEGFDKDEGETLYEEIEAHIKQQSGVELEITQVNWFSIYKVHARHVERFHSGRCFLAGDSAHVHTPVGAQGMNTGIQDAYNLAWKLAFVLRGKSHAQLLESYNHERLENARRLVETTDRMFNLVSDDSRFMQFMRTIVMPPIANFILHRQWIKQRFFPFISQIGINYRSSPLSDHSSQRNFAVKAGDRMPWFELDGVSVYDRLRNPVFHLITFANLGTNDGRATVNAGENRLTDMLDYQVLPLTPEVARAFGTKTPFNVLLRPDNHIGIICQAISPEPIKAYLSRVMAHPVD